MIVKEPSRKINPQICEHLKPISKKVNQTAANISLLQ
jgi:hypothetical protein